MSDHDSHIDSQQSVMKKITASEFAAKFPTKRDVWRFLANEVSWYLPPVDTVTIWHLRDMARGKRSHIKNSNLRVIHIPQYEGLTVETLHAEAKKNPNVMRALPEVEKEVLKLPRAYIGNVMVTFLGNSFERWVEQRVRERNAKLKDDRKLELELDEDIAAIFHASTSIGGKYIHAINIYILVMPFHDTHYVYVLLSVVSKGNSANLMKPGAKRRRSKETIKEEKRQEAQKTKEMAAAIAELMQYREAEPARLALIQQL